MIQFLCYSMLCLIWGSTWLVIKIGYGNLGPFNVAAVRFLVAGTVFVLLVPILRAPWPRGRTQWLLVLWVGIFLFTGDYGFVYWAETRLDSGLTAIIFAVLPLMTSIAAHFYLESEKLTLQKLLGTMLAFAGVTALFADRFSVDASQVAAMAALMGAALCAVISMLAMKRYGSALHPAALNAPAMLLGAVLLMVLAVATGEHLQWPSGHAAWGAVIYLALAGSVVTFLIYFWLLKKWTATTMSFINVVTPLVAVWLGFMFRGERPTPWTGLGGGLVLCGVLVSMWKR